MVVAQCKDSPRETELTSPAGIAMEGLPGYSKVVNCPLPSITTLKNYQAECGVGLKTSLLP
jgi:hypothetical protein